MEFTAGQLATFVDGKIIGDENAIISGVSPIERGEPGHLSFVAQAKFAGHLETSQCSVLIVSEHLLQDKSYPFTIIAVPDAYLAFQVLMNMYQQMQENKSGIEQPSFIHPSVALPEDIYVGAFAYISEGAKIGPGTKIHPQTYIGKNVKIGKNCRIDCGVKIYDYVVIGDHCVINANSVIGSDGFGFQPSENGYQKIPQLGNVVLKDYVEVGANCTLDRGTIGSTIIGEGTKIDNLIQIAHNVEIGKHNVIAAQAGIAGSTTIGDWNMIGGQAGIVGHINIGNRVRIQAQSGVNANTPDGTTLYGSPAMDAGQYRRSYVLFKKLPEMSAQIDRLDKATKNQSHE